MLLYAAFAVTLAFLDHRVRRFPQHVVTEYVPSVLAGTSGAPAKYRVLMPYGLDGLTRWTGADPYTVFLIVELVSIFAALCALHLLLRNWFSARTALAGVTGAAALLPITFTNSWAHPDTFPDLALFALGCHFVVRHHTLALAGVLLVGMLNRETIGFVLLLWIVHHWLPSPSLVESRRVLFLAAVCIAVYVGLRWARGFETYRLVMIGENLQMLKLLPPGFDPYTRVAGYFWLILFGPATLLAWRGLKQPGAPRYLRSSLVTALLFFVVAWLFAAIIEVRVFVPMIALMLPAALYGAAEPEAAG
jgi:hypothetical protein